MECFLGSIN